MRLAARFIRLLASATRAFLKNILAGCRLSLFFPAGGADFTASVAQATLLLALSVLLNFSYDYLTTRPDHYFNLFGLYYQATLYLLFFFSAVVIAALENAQARMVAFAVMVFSTAPATFIVYVAAYWASVSLIQAPHEYVYWGVAGLYLCWHLGIVSRILRLLFRAAPLRLAGYAAIYVVCNLLPWWALPNQALWEANYGGGDYRRGVAPIDLEKLFYSQADLLERDTGALLPQRPGVIDLYFLGFAGYSGEDVFMNEARLARQLFDERFDTDGRSLLLVNNRQTLAELPMATRHNLTYALRRVSELIDPEEDVVFLFFTSHGEEDAGLTVQVGPYSLSGISPDVLADALALTRIRWRVIVVSACYWGGFIDALQNPQTLIITAARRDRNSFGCGHNGDFTYFGQAYFGEALRQDYSFAAAFERARSEIWTREQQQKLTPSQPQIVVGAEIQTVLDNFLEKLRNRPPLRPDGVAAN